MSSSAVPAAELGSEFWIRHGWKFSLGLVLVIGLFGVGDLLKGDDRDAATTEDVRA